MVATHAPQTSSLELVFRPTSEPSKYIDHVPLVDDPHAVAENSARSSSTPLAPVTLQLPRKLTIRLPAGDTAIDEMSSPLVVKPTSEPSKNIANVPAVVEPSEVGVNCTMSESSTVPTPDTLGALSKLIRIVPSESNANALMSALGSTSEPSKYIDHVFVPVSKRMISSSANETPPTLPLVLELI